MQLYIMTLLRSTFLGKYHASAAVATCLMVLFAHTACADTTGAAKLVAPAKADTIASPVVFRTIQTSTEADNLKLPLKPDGTSLHTTIGIDTYLGGRVKLYDIPVSYAFTPDLYARLDLPIATAGFDAAGGGSDTETGIGDISLSLKLRTDIEELFELYYILAAKFPSGDADKGLGTGSYEFSYTQKLIKWFGDYRATFMAGISIPPPVDNTSILGSKVEYGPTLSYMAAVERTLFSPNLIFGLRAAGLHAFNSRINKTHQLNSLTTLDIIPEVIYYTSNNAGFHLGVIVPAITAYELPGAANSRDAIINLAVFKAF